MSDVTSPKASPDSSPGSGPAAPTHYRRSDHHDRPKEAPMTTATYDVEGMTCGHCVNAVSSGIARLPGVTDVAVDLDTGKVTVTSDTPLDTGAVRGAVDEAGYELMA
jgi:copper chaperone